MMRAASAASAPSGRFVIRLCASVRILRASASLRTPRSRCKSSKAAEIASPAMASAITVHFGIGNTLCGVVCKWEWRQRGAESRGFGDQPSRRSQPGPYGVRPAHG
jgi:hypothetical protein